MAKTKYDEVLLGILKEEAHLYPFLDVIFGFLYRCTDFYEIQKSPEDKLGFPVGIAHGIVTKVFKKWETAADKNKECSERERRQYPCLTETCNIQEPNGVHNADNCVTLLSSEESLPPLGREETVISNDHENEAPITSDTTSCHLKPNPRERKIQKHFQSSDSSYNGAVRDGYQWTQSISDIDVQVTVPPHITKGKDVKVDVLSSHISVSVSKEHGRKEWFAIFEGDLCFPTNKEESVWSLVPGNCVQIHLEKHQERWWDALFTSEPKIDLKQIDASRPMEDLSQEEQMKIQELIWNQERKLQGLSTSENMEMEKILKDAWNKEGSPFSGRPYNPKDISFANNSIRIDNHDPET